MGGVGHTLGRSMLLGLHIALMVLCFYTRSVALPQRPKLEAEGGMAFSPTIIPDLMSLVGEGEPDESGKSLVQHSTSIATVAVGCFLLINRTVSLT